MQADFLTFHFTRISRHIAGFPQGRAEGFIILDQRAGDAMANGTRLTGRTAAGDIDGNIDLVAQLGEFKRLQNDHPVGFSAEVFVQHSVVDDNLTRADFRVDSRYSAFAATRSIILRLCHGRPECNVLDFQRFGLLSLMFVLVARVDFELFEHGTP